MADFTGGNSDEVITGSPDPETLKGGAGDDTIKAGDGGDLVSGGQDDDSIIGGGGNDSIAGFRGDDIISSGGGDDRVQGGEGNDLINAGKGDDRLEGNEGSDVLWGGAGADTFVFRGSSLQDGDIDFIKDFSLAEGDTMLFDGFAFVTSVTVANYADKSFGGFWLDNKAGKNDVMLTIDLGGGESQTIWLLDVVNSVETASFWETYFL